MKHFTSISTAVMKNPFTHRRLEPIKKQTIFSVSDAENRPGLVVRACPVCKKEFAIYRSLTKNTKNSYCSTECYDVRNPVLSYAKKMKPDQEGVLPISKARRILKQKGEFKDKKEQYKDKIVSYPESPTGRAYVGINKSPFMPAVDGGHGYQGVLIQDENREFVQCHSCGKWMQKITSKHIESCSGLTVQAFKEKYGLNSDHGLVSDETSLRLTKACLKNKDKETMVANFKKNIGKRRSKRHSIEFFNKYGTCPLQLKTRLYEFIRCNRELPSQGNKGRPIYKALRRRYGSFGHALSANGLPWMKRQGTTMRFAFPDGTIYKYNINQFHDREALFQLMMQKCPELQ